MVTRETFNAWEIRFLAEQAAAGSGPRGGAQRLTGRQLFEQDASMIMSDDVFIKKMEASLGSSAAEDEKAPAPAAAPVPMALVPVPQADELLVDPSNQYLFGDDDDLFEDDEADDEADAAAPAPAPAPAKKTPPLAKPTAPAPAPAPAPALAAAAKATPPTSKAAPQSAPSPASVKASPKPAAAGKGKSSKK